MNCWSLAETAFSAPTSSSLQGYFMLHGVKSQQQQADCKLQQATAAT